MITLTNVWISATYAIADTIYGQGLWYAPSLNLAGQTKVAPAVDPDDALRVGCAVAIQDAFAQLGEDLVFHIPATPAPYWLRGSRYPVPLGARTERLEYTTTIDAWLQKHPGGFIVSDSDTISMDSLCGQNHLCADYDAYSHQCQTCGYPLISACEEKGAAHG